VLSYVMRELPRLLGHPVRIDLLTGTSVGALHACYLAATAHQGADRCDRLVRLWRGLRIEQLFGTRAADVLRLPRRMLGLLRAPGALHGDRPPDRLYGLLDTRELERVVVRSTPWRSIRANLTAGHVDALGLTATEIATGRVVTFVETRGQVPPRWTRDPSVLARPVHIGPSHALASASIPFLFPAVRVGETYYADGGLRLNTPLSPALRLGADRVLVVALRRGPAVGSEGDLEARRVEHYGNPLFLFGKVLNALLLDHVDEDLARMRLLNDVLRRAREVGGADFLARINETVQEDRGQPYKIVEDLVVRPSEDLGVLAGDVARGEHGRTGAPVALRLLLRALGVGDEPLEADLLSYLLFDASYARVLLDLGYRDAGRMEAELVRFFTD